MTKRQEEAKILIGCECGHSFSQWDLYFCSSCQKIRCVFGDFLLGFGKKEKLANQQLIQNSFN